MSRHQTAQKHEERTYTLEEHFAEIKHRLILCVISFIILFLALSILGGDIYKIILETATKSGFTFITLSPQEALMQKLKVAAVLSLFIAVPVALYNLIAFVTEPDDLKDRIRILSVILVIEALFIVGVTISISVIFPFMLSILKNFVVNYEIISLTTSVSEYISLYTGMLLIYGCLMEMPVVTIVLSKLGVLNSELLRKSRPYAIIIIFLLAALVTPPDVTSQIIVGVPTCLVYILCELICRLCAKKSK